jgi:hypothetical protein
MRTGGDLRTDLLEVRVHPLSVGGRHDDRGALAQSRADRTIQIGGVMTGIAHHGGPRATPGPDVGMPTLLPDPGFILKPDLNRFALGSVRQGVLTQGREVCLNAAWAAKS